MVEVLRARIATATRLPVPLFETPQVLHYAVGQQYRPHHDYLEASQVGHAANIARRGQRIATFLLYLNDEYDGGETRFDQAGVTCRAAARMGFSSPT
ncbi:MAG: hypothetical protein AVDCRST_MAG44-1098 [uncultured Sphingomonas sp.]|uniref:Prolyl 4-hydroxylase alpha subunit Fe(2+) 2OG dioxygenase domain-containing protein n=1 Tax=uncultured Sphingomonas sp. TaxID=158754 RepID=A0A6J4SVD9_9SPHN|nr:MAG: hypothetical protein AVDCRST_MAG44-1098 [uncultured Sphingomonas sp.]